MYDEHIMINILLYLENNFDGIRHTTINEDTYDLNKYCVHAYLENGVNYIDVYKKFEQLPTRRIIIGEMRTDRSNEVIEILKSYNYK